MSDEAVVFFGTPMNIMQILDLICIITVDVSPAASAKVRKLMADLAMEVEDDSSLLRDRLIVAPAL